MDKIFLDKEAYNLFGTPLQFGDYGTKCFCYHWDPFAFIPLQFFLIFAPLCVNFFRDCHSFLITTQIFSTCFFLFSINFPHFSLLATLTAFIGMRDIVQEFLPSCLSARPQIRISSCYRLYLPDCATGILDILRYPSSVAVPLVIMEIVPDCIDLKLYLESWDV